jgi:hypothetical protein
VTTAPARGAAWRILIALYFGLALVLTAAHGYAVNYGPNQKLRQERHERLASGGGEAPWAYRVLSPAVSRATGAALAPALSRPEDRREVGYLLQRFGFTLAFFWMFHRIIEAWLPPAWALAGVAIAAALHGPASSHYWFQPDSPGDLALWAAAALLSLRGRGLWIAPLIALGALNRETAVFAAPIHLALVWGAEPRARSLGRTAILLACWALPTLALRAWIQPSGWAGGQGWSGALQENLGHTEWWLYALSFGGAWLWLPLRALPTLPPPLKRLIFALIPYLGLVLVFGRLRELRLLLPLTLAFVPAALWTLRAQLEGEGPAATRP